MEKSSNIGMNILKKLGFSFPNGDEEIPVEIEKSADFLVTFDNEKFIVEVKLKMIDKKKELERESTLSNREVYIDDTENYISTSIDNIVKDANKQLSNSSNKYDISFKFLLFIPISYNADIHAQQLINTLYGKVDVVDIQTKKLYLVTHTTGVLFYVENLLIL